LKFKKKGVFHFFPSHKHRIIFCGGFFLPKKMNQATGCATFVFVPRESSHINEQIKKWVHLLEDNHHASLKVTDTNNNISAVLWRDHIQKYHVDVDAPTWVCEFADGAVPPRGELLLPLTRLHSGHLDGFSVICHRGFHHVCASPVAEWEEVSNA
jgi:hypothetical protein